MTDMLRTLLHERATSVNLATPDLDTITRVGARRVRRRRRIGIASVGATIAVTVAVPFALTSDGDSARDGSPQIADVPSASEGAFPRGPLNYASGNVIYYGDEALDVGVPVGAFVQTAYGFVVASEGDVYEVDGIKVQKIGQIDAERPRLVADNDGTLAGWVQRGSEPAFAIQDLAADVTSIQAIEQPVNPDALADGEDPAYFYDIEDGTAYWRDARGAVAFDVATGSSQVVDAEARNGFDLVDVENGQLVFYGEEGIEIGPTRADAKPLAGISESRGVLSPQATYYAPDAEELRVVDVTSGLDVTPPLEGYAFSTAFGWLGRDTVVVIALKDLNDVSPISLLTCSVSNQTCTSAVTAGEIGEVQLPSGTRLGE